MPNFPEPIFKKVNTSHPEDPWYKKTWDYISKPTLIELVFDWKVELLDGTKAMVTAGTRSDGASVPWFLRPFATSFGPLLKGGLLHDDGYRRNALLDWDKKRIYIDAGKPFFDDLFRDVVNYTTGLSWLAAAAYASVKKFGFRAWNKHRENDQN